MEVKQKKEKKGKHKKHQKKEARVSPTKGQPICRTGPTRDGQLPSNAAVLSS